MNQAPIEYTIFHSHSQIDSWRSNGVFLEVEEFLLMLDGYGWVTSLFVDLAEHVEAHV